MMSTFRQPSPPAVLLRTLSARFPPGMRIDEHAHAWPQLVFAERGALTVSVEDRRWVVPPHRALWVPGNRPHSVEMLGEVWMRTLYLAAHDDKHPGDNICVLEINPLLRELILEATRTGCLESDLPLHGHLSALINNQLTGAMKLPFDLPMPRNERARRVARRTLESLHRSDTLLNLAQDSGASARTLERLFQTETKLSFGQWRRQARLQHALRRLAESADVATVASECGYESVSAFVSMFRQALGGTPGQYVRQAKIRGG